MQSGDRTPVPGSFQPGVRHFILVGILMAVVPAVIQAREPYTDAKLKEVEAWLPDKPGVTHHPVSDRAYWEKVRAVLGDGVITAAENALKSSNPPWSEETYRIFFKTGSRREGEEMLHPRSERLKSFVAAECLEGKGRFIMAIQDQLLELSKQPSWVLPAHDHDHEIIDGKAVYLELSSANLGCDIALSLEWFGEKMNPAARTVVEAALKQKVIEPVFAVLEKNDPLITARHWWRTAKMNWNAVCTAGSTGAVLSFEPSKRRRALAVLDAVENAHDYLAGFTKDGYCGEGPGYWVYGFGHFLVLTDLLQHESGGRIRLGQFPNASAAATYPERISMDGPVFPAFADAGINSSPDAWARWWAGLLVQGKSEPYPGKGPHGPMVGTLAQWYFIGLDATAPAGAAPVVAPLALHDEFPDGGVLISRVLKAGKVTFSAAMKGGHNGEDHNHNDVGSYVIDLNGTLPVLDPGNTVYTAKTFSKERYDHPILSSYGHSVPRINGQLQTTGRSSAAKITTRTFSAEQDIWEIDLSSCYPKTGLKSLDRRWTFKRGVKPSLQVLDTVKFTETGTFETAVIGTTNWAKADDKTWFVRDGKSILKVSIETSSPAEFRVEKLANPKRFEPGRLGIRLRDKVQEACVRITLEPATETEWSSAQVVENLPVIEKSPQS